MSDAKCPSCNNRVNFPGPPRLGQKVTCPHCGEYLEVVELGPVVLDFEYEDDDDDEFDDYDDYDEFDSAEDFDDYDDDDDDDYDWDDNGF